GTRPHPASVRRADSMIELRNGAARALIQPGFGGRVVSLEFDGREHLADGACIEGDPWRGGSYPLAPWPGTLPRGSVVSEAGARLEVPQRSDGTLKHGYVRSMSWETVS